MGRVRTVGVVAAVALAASSWTAAVADPIVRVTVDLGPESVEIEVDDDDAARLLAEAVERVRAEGRGFDQATNPDYLVRLAPLVADYLSGADTESVRVDPFRAGWDGRRGEHQTVTYRNRYGARIVADLFSPALPHRDPVTGARGRGPFPGLVLVPGAGSRGDDYLGVAQSLAEGGYVVLAFDPQGQGRSEAAPAREFCDPTGAWRAPQEAGLVERGRCAGAAPFPPLEHPLADLAPVLAGTPAGPFVDVMGQLLAYKLDYEGFLEQVRAAYPFVGPNYVFGALDARDWLVSPANPLQALVDPDRIGVLGHSLGAWGAITAANGDPQRGFAAAAAFDGFAPTPVQPTVPSLFLVAEGLDTDFPAIPPTQEPARHPWVEEADRWLASGVDAMQVSLRASTHQEWYYTPFALANPIAGPLRNASSEGERVSVHYLLAWFDLHLRGPEHRADALRRLTTRVFDASADRSSIGQGTYDLRTGRNRPYTVAGERVAEHLSRVLPSAYDIAGARCDDLVRRGGC